MSINHGVLIKELYDAITGVPEFQDITGTNLGAMEPDPTLIALVPPACWISFIGDTSQDDTKRLPPTSQTLDLVFMAFIYLPMRGQKHMTEDDLPLLAKVAKGVNGLNSPTSQRRWAYTGQKLMLINTNRMVYAQRYCILGQL